MFELSKLLTPVLDPRTLLFMGVLAGTLLLWTRFRGLGRLLVSLGVAVALLFILLPIGPTALHRLEHRFPRPVLAERVDGIIALGGDFDVTLGHEYGPASAPSPRLLALAELGRGYPDARLVFTGGIGPGGLGVVEADIAPRILTAMGFDASRVLFEGKARNTRENATFAKGLVNPGAGETWLLITSASHMPRAVGVFRAAGWPVIPYPVEFRAVSGGRRFSMEGGFESFARATHEGFGLAYYRLRGWTDALFPSP